jgi:hypothetical protein
MTDLKVIDGKSPATRDPREQKFDSAYGEWAQALTDVAKFNESVECATEEEREAMNAQLCDRRTEAEWQLIMIPVFTGVQLIQKFEVLEAITCRGAWEGYPTDNRHVLMLASVNADLWKSWKFSA